MGAVALHRARITEKSYRLTASNLEQESQCSYMIVMLATPRPRLIRREEEKRQEDGGRMIRTRRTGKKVDGREEKGRKRSR